jgi:gliding motility-associatede transport system auxiliary component
MRRFIIATLSVLGVLGILAGINLAAETRLAGRQLDLTQGQVYTLSPGTRAILAGLKDPITLKFYFSSLLGTKVPAYGAYADRVRAMLAQYVQASHGMLRVENYDPLPFSPTEDQALGYGLQGVPVDQAGTAVYFGVVGTDLLDDEATIPFMQPSRENFLEYDLTKLVYQLSNPVRPKIGLMSPLPADGDMQLMMMTHNPQAAAPWASVAVLRQSFDVADIPTTAQVIPADIKVLVLLQPQHLSQTTLYAIDQFVMRGGRLMLLVDPASEAQAEAPSPTGQPPSDTASNLEPLLHEWGIAYDPHKVVGDLDGAWAVQAPAGSRVSSVDYVAWFNITNSTPGGINRADPATADLQQVTVASPGFISKLPGAAIDFTPLLTSGKQSDLLNASQVGALADPVKILAGFKPAGHGYVIAARVSGMLHSAFKAPPPEAKGPDGKPVPRPKDFPAYIAETAKPAQMVVIADTDIMANRFWVQTQDFFGQTQTTPFSDNGAFIGNLAGTLAGSDALLGLRARGVTVRPFTRIDAMQRVAEARFRRTEQELQAHLDAAQKQLTALRTGRGEKGATAVITEQQRQAISKLETDMIDTRARLRQVQFDLRRDIQSLEDRIRLIDVAAVPLLLVVFAIGLAAARARRRARARS